MGGVGEAGGFHLFEIYPMEIQGALQYANFLKKPHLPFSGPSWGLCSISSFDGEEEERSGLVTKRFWFLL